MSDITLRRLTAEDFIKRLSEKQSAMVRVIVDTIADSLKQHKPDELIWRWVGSPTIKQLSGYDYPIVRKHLEPLCGGLLDRSRTATSTVTSYSLKKLDGYTIKGDYFIKDEYLHKYYPVKEVS